MRNFLSITNDFFLVIYTDERSVFFLPKTFNRSRVRVILKPVHEFYNFKYSQQWIQNHEKNDLLKDLVAWEMNMLWSEKLAFVRETKQKNYFGTDLFGWCDIGYFRNRIKDTSTSLLTHWSNAGSLSRLNTDKIHYACVNNDMSYVNDLMSLVQKKNQHGLPKEPIPPEQFSVAGGFFVAHKSLVEDWFRTYDAKLALYFHHDYLVKDDQTILVDCIFSELHRFQLHLENQEEGFDPWFMFQRILK